MAVELPPGIPFIVRNLPTILIPPILWYTILGYLSRTTLNLDMPTWALAAVASLAWPITLVLRGKLDDVSVRRQAAAQGAVLPPRLEDDSFGGITALLAMAKELSAGYMGTSFSS